MTDDIDWVAEVNEMRTNEERILEGVRYSSLEKNITGHFIHPRDDQGNIICTCGQRLIRQRIKSHLKSQRHNRWVKTFLNKQLHKPCQYTDYSCTKGIYEGYKLEDVIYADPDYIDFLIRDYSHEFPVEFTTALRACGLKW